MKKLSIRNRLNVIMCIAFMIAGISFYEFVIFSSSALSSSQNIVRSIPAILSFLFVSILPVTLFLLLQAKKKEQFESILKVTSLLSIIVGFLLGMLFIIYIISKLITKEDFYVPTLLYPIDLIIINFLFCGLGVFVFLHYDNFNLEKMVYHGDERKVFSILNYVLFFIYYPFASYFFGSFILSIFSFLNYGGNNQIYAIPFYLVLIQSGLVYLVSIFLDKTKKTYQRNLLIVFCVSLICSGLMLTSIGLNPNIIDQELSPFFPLEVHVQKNVSPMLLTLVTLLPPVYLEIKNFLSTKQSDNGIVD